MKRYLVFLIASSFVFSFSTIKNSIAAEDSVYDFSWLDKDKEVYVLQNRKFRKKSKLTVGATFGRSINGAFVDSNEVNLLASYFVSEDWGLEFSYTKADGSLNKTHDSVKEQGAKAFYKKIDTAMAAMLMWSPFYSKINTFNKIFYYDWLFGVGLTNVSTLDNRNEFTTGPNNGELTSESSTAFTWTTGLRFYINEHWSTRIDFKAIHNSTEVQVTDTEEEERILSYYNFNVGLNYTF